MLAALLVSLLQDAKPTVQDTARWKAYAAELAKAQMVELRWTVTRNGKLEDRFVLLVRAKSKISLERTGDSLTVWDGEKGIHISHRQRTYHWMKEKQNFEWAAWFEVPGVLKGEGYRSTSRVKQTVHQANGRTYDVVSATYNAIDASSQISFYFDRQTRLIAWMTAEVRGMIAGGEQKIETRVEKFDLYAMVPSESFKLVPPEGYKEWVPKSGGGVE